MNKGILLRTGAVCAVFLAASWIPAQCGLQFRIWIREPVTLLIPEKRLKTVMIVLWSAAMKSVTSTAIETGT